MFLGHRLSRQRSLDVAIMRVLVLTAYPEIASGGNAQTQCPTRRRIRTTFGPWMTVRLQDTLSVEVGLSFSGPQFLPSMTDWIQTVATPH